MADARLFQNILCPVDFSDHSRQALAYAALLTSREKGRLTILFVEHAMLVAAAAIEYDEKKLLEKARKELRRFAERAIAPYRLPSGAVGIDVAVGEPHEEIARVATRLDAGLVVAGAHGWTGANKLMFGSTTHRLLRSLPIPLLATPPAGKRQKALSRSWPGKHALAPVDLDPQHRSDAVMAAIAARELGVKLELIHVIEPITQPPWIELDAARRNQQLKRLAVEQFGSLSKELDWAASGYTVETGKPAARIAAVAAKEKIGLVIMTKRAGEGLFGPRQGAISYEVLCRAATPVLALPSGGEWTRRAQSFMPPI